jgi:regulator of protease activity HflC (stomatin/prohibitin superfamily)
MVESILNSPSAGIDPSPRGSSRLGRLLFRVAQAVNRNSVSVYAFILGFMLLVMVLAPRIFINVPAGHVGVLWLRFFDGTVTDHYYGEGVHVIFPWDEVYIYDARLQNQARIYDTISSNGLSMQVEIAIRYRINRDTVGLLHQLIGPHYDEVLVFPEIGSEARELISRYTPEQLYSETRAFIQAQILERMVTQLGGSMSNQSVRGKLVDIEDVLIRSVNLPPRVQEAIEHKAEQYQAMLEYDFRIEREKKERDRKKIEAEGVRDFQDTVAKTITPEYLRLRGIEATMTLATSPNSKLVVIGGKDGLPLILNTGDDAALSGAGNSETKAAKAGHAEATSTAPAPPNARMMDVPPPNAAVPLDRGTRTPSAPAKPDAVPLLVAPSPPPAARNESEASPASKEPSLLDHAKAKMSEKSSETR